MPKWSSLHCRACLFLVFGPSLGLSFYLSRCSKSSLTRKFAVTGWMRRSFEVFCPWFYSHPLTGCLVESRAANHEDLRNKEARSFERASLGLIPAATYSPTQLPVQYHRLRRA